MKQIVKNSLVASSSLLALVGLVFVPTLQASAAADNDPTTITATIAPMITMTAGATVGFTLTPSTGVAESNGSNVVSVSTNNSTGYYLSIADQDATLTLTNGANTIAASANTYATPATLATNTWGYAIPGGNFSAVYTSQTDVTTSTLKYTGITASAQTIKTTATTATNDTTTVWYGAKVDTSKPTGAYTDSITFVATTN
jgi:hypothetical protein